MSYRKVGNNKYRVEVERTIKGERFRKSEVLETKKKSSELKALVNSIEIKLYDQIAIEANDPKKLGNKTIYEFMEYYINSKPMEQTSKEFYEGYTRRHTKDFFGSKRIKDIKSIDIKKFFEFLQNYISPETKKPYSKKTLYHYRTALNALFNKAKEDEIIEENPVKVKITAPKRTLGKNFYEPYEVKKNLEYLQKYGLPEYHLMYLLFVITGIRPGEMSALRWGKLNWDTKELLINKSLTKTKDKGYIYKSTKTEDTRTLMITNHAITLLKAHREREKQKWRRLGQPLTDETYIFTTEQGNFISSNTFQQYWKRFCSNHNLRYVKPYGLRHTAGTLLALNNIPMANIANQLGHSEQSTTEIYVHASDTIQSRIVDIMDEVTSPKLTLVKNI